MAVLTVAQQRAGAPQPQVKLRKTIAGSQLRKIPNGIQSRPRLIRQQGCGYHEISVRPAITAANPPPQLVELSETESFRLHNHQGVDRRNVDAVLDNRGGKQYLGFSIDKGQEGFFNHLTAHPRVNHRHIHFRKPRVELAPE